MYTEDRQQSPKFNFWRKEPKLTDAEVLEDLVIEELILKLNQPEKWLIVSWGIYEFSNGLNLTWKGHDDRQITAPARLAIPKRWYDIVQKKVDAIENFTEASKNRFLLSYLRGEYTIQVELPGKKKNYKTLEWLLNTIKEDPYYYQENKNIVWFKTEKIATFCKTALG